MLGSSPCFSQEKSTIYENEQHNTMVTGALKSIPEVEQASCHQRKKEVPQVDQTENNKDF